MPCALLARVGRTAAGIDGTLDHWQRRSQTPWYRAPRGSGGPLQCCHILLLLLYKNLGSHGRFEGFHNNHSTTDILFQYNYASIRVFISFERPGCSSLYRIHFDGRLCWRVWQWQWYLRTLGLAPIGDGPHVVPAIGQHWCHMDSRKRGWVEYDRCGHWHIETVSRVGCVMKVWAVLLSEHWILTILAGSWCGQNVTGATLLTYHGVTPGNDLKALISFS